MLRVAVCEDDLMQAEIILALLDKYQKDRPGTAVHPSLFHSADDILKSIDNGQQFNLFLLDILLPEMNGIELAKTLRSLPTDAPIIFLTSSADYALDAFKVSAAQYILKPVKHDELFPVLDNITALFKHEKERFFMLTTNKHSVKIQYRSIVCVELVGRSLRFYLDDGNILTSNTIRMSFSDAISPLLEDDRFLCGHKSFAINMEHVTEVGNSSFKMTGDLEVPVPRYKFAKAKASYFTWVNKYNYT